MPRGNRLSNMKYDEVSLVDSGACNDADVVLFKRDTSGALVIDISKAFQASDGGTSAPAASSKKKSKSKRKKGTTERAQNWNEGRHPRVKAGSGDPSGEFSSTSADSKRKYGKGGTAKDNLPSEYKTSNKSAAGLQHGISASQRRMLDKDKAETAAAEKKKKQDKIDAAKKKKEAAAKKKQSAKDAAARELAGSINALADNQRAAYRKQGREIPAGYAWTSDNKLVPKDKAALDAKVSAGLPAAETKTTTSTSTKSKTTTKKRLVLRNGKMVWETYTVPVSKREDQLLAKWLYTERKAS